MKKIFLATILTMSLTGCGASADGVYVGTTESGFMAPSLTITLEIKGDKAEMKVADMDVADLKKLSMTAERTDSVINLHQGNPNDTMKFHIINDGQTLQCNQCTQAGLPTLWEKQS
ncbi:hypothetical protein AB4571_01895 [Vibrio breoganii]|uniref:hypothetical protein n=1 Tax=Vibrio breoganii TaxID=553239 RepID=UPI000C824231|nr:hypothetical protein [Vibrio breoganii]PML12666.1 hypothetical protein BCT84_01945 [Vibrio breoganii]